MLCPAGGSSAELATPGATRGPNIKAVASHARVGVFIGASPLEIPADTPRTRPLETSSASGSALTPASVRHGPPRLGVVSPFRQKVSPRPSDQGAIVKKLPYD